MKKLFKVVDNYINIKTVLDNIDEIYITKNDLLSKLDKIQNIQKLNLQRYIKNSKIQFNPTTDSDDITKKQIAENYLFDLLKKVNQDITDKVLLDKLKKFIDKHGIIDEETFK